MATGAGPWPEYMDGLMGTPAGSIDRRYPKYWWNGEGGIDFWVRVGVPIIALADGEIEGAGGFSNPIGNYFMSSCVPPDYGVVTTRVRNGDGSYTSLYYQHIMIASGITYTQSGSKGQKVKKGDIIGYGNPEAWIEMGVNVQNAWGGIWGTQPAPGPHIDPENYIRALATAYTGSTTGVSLTPGTINTNTGLLSFTTTTAGAAFATMSELTHQAINNVPGFQGLVEGLDLIEQFQPFEMPGTTSDPNSQLVNPFNWLSPATGYIDIGSLAHDAQVASGIANNTIGGLPTLSAETMQAGIQFITWNTAAFTMRAILVTLGMIIIIALIMNLVNGAGGNSSGQSALGPAQIAQVAAMAA